MSSSFPSQTKQELAQSVYTDDLTPYFEFLPDSLVLLIFNKLADVKALGKCSVVSKRFYELVPKVENVSVKVDRLISANGKRKRFFRNLKRLLFGHILKPFQFLHVFRKAIPTETSIHSPLEVLQNFKEIQHLRIELPAGELIFGSDVLLKWKAEFGSTLESCVILGASSLIKDEIPQKVGSLKNRLRIAKNRSEQSSQSSLSVSDDLSVQDDRNPRDTLYAEDDLKLRVVWTISSLIAASARHFLLERLISDHPTLERLILTDANDQGTLSMNRTQLQSFRDNPSAASVSFSRTQVPHLSIRLWHAPYLKLSKGTALKGATLVAIAPSNQIPCKDDNDFINEAFEEPFKTATSKLSRRRTYLLEMSSF